eukprot:CAMPEP_0185160020 /NCGR_PEP_ID=MMETSP1139-20130426/3384_1 /TAXON_ID=298111 /ORGANISM="Pavlova sp., Strain CCMP459" /LENGTH=657 /DNA_ID=CAMNT_0027725211 /DNA_START=19 /DNA_END=1990 /DNA_ORIENTATION=+
MRNKHPPKPTLNPLQQDPFLMVNNKPRQYVVIGAVAGGAACAARLRRLDEQASIIVFEKGPDPSFANCGMPYYIGGEIKERGKLAVQTPKSLNARLNLDVRTLTEVLSIDTAGRSVRAKNLVNGEEYSVSYDELLLSPGAKPFLPPIPGIERAGNLSLRNLEDMDRIKTWIEAQQCKTAVVAGGGFIGIEMAEQLHRLGMDVTIVEALPQLMAPFDPEVASVLQTELQHKGVKVIVGAPIKGFEPPAKGGPGSDVVLDEARRLPADVVILGLGVRADTALPKAAGIELNARGGIVVDEHMRTSDPHVYAVGDATQVHNPITGGEWMVALAGPAARQGRVAADNMSGKVSGGRTYKGTWGSSAVRVFDLTAAGTGLNERGLEMAGVKYHAVHLHPSHHAGYFPGAETLSLKILFGAEGDTRGKLLGAQAVASEGADKAIDALAVALQAGMTVDDLAELELCYAPPVGSAKSPINYAGMIAQDMLEGLIDTAQWKELPAIVADPNTIIVDVRNPGELESKGVLHESAMNVPLDQVRSRLAELPRDKTIVVSCLSGQRGYYAARILRQEGFTVKNLDGGLRTYSSCPLGVAAGKAASDDDALSLCMTAPPSRACAVRVIRCPHEPTPRSRAGSAVAPALRNAQGQAPRDRLRVTWLVAGW